MPVRFRGNFDQLETTMFLMESCLNSSIESEIYNKLSTKKLFSTVGFRFRWQYFYNWFFLKWIKYYKHQFLWDEDIIAILRDFFISKISLRSDYFERTWVWSEPVSSALQSDHKWLQVQLGLSINASSALESDHSLIKVCAMVWIWVWTLVWRWSDQIAFGLKSLIRDLLCLESLIRGNLGQKSLIRVNFRLVSLIRDNFGLESLIRQTFGSGPQPGMNK